MSDATHTVATAAQRMCEELLPATNPGSVAADTMTIVSAVPVAPAAPECDFTDTSIDGCEFLPATNPGSVATDAVAFVGAPPPVPASPQGNPATTRPYIELLPATNPGSVANDAVAFVSAPFPASSASEGCSHSISDEKTQAGDLCFHQLGLGLGRVLTDMRRRSQRRCFHEAFRRN